MVDTRAFSLQSLPEPETFQITINREKSEVDLLRCIRSTMSDASGVKYLQFPSLFGDFLIGLDDLKKRVDDATWESNLKADIKYGTITNCDLWAHNGSKISIDIFAQSRLGRTVRRKDLQSYRSQWIICFSAAIEMANSEPTARKGFDILNRFYVPPENTTFCLLLIPCEGMEQLLGDAISDAKRWKNDWGVRLDPSILTERQAETKGYIKFSRNPLRLYTTWIQTLELYRLISWQTGRDKETTWLRPLPELSDTNELNQTLLDSTHKTGLKYDTVNAAHSTSLSQYPGERLVHFRRISPESVMGESANQWALNVLKWPGPKDRVAEWLHLIAHRFDPRTADTFSNLIFGTKECNTDMMRAEAVVTQLLQSAKACAVNIQATAIYNEDWIEINNEGPVPKFQPVYWPAQGNMNAHPHWLTTKVRYTIEWYYPSKARCMNFAKYPPIRYARTTEFSPFSSRCPFRFEYEFDKILLRKLLEYVPAVAPNVALKAFHATLDKTRKEHIDAMAKAKIAEEPEAKVDLSDYDYLSDSLLEDDDSADEQEVSKYYKRNVPPSLLVAEVVLKIIYT
ncbi:hypothetical protein FRC12_002743 [Ceratobasidium sp. 428]|nr:hypothetical protein FRC12_002743 [Ceratobasidium sp. 428]